ncbi:MAG: tRNA preQ1(34) S-adenosylmethionine ribosyltransferase-isomerase QueA [Thermoanaerobaculia bacterium]|nr:tRNA preQ1(34) S-adenosylmethionine ribosyltransferase-isomerase QueA [Thermoanaerobaculia bacterium]
MNVSDFDYHLPPGSIAQRPAPRGTSRLLVLDRHSGDRSQRSIQDLPSLLDPGDLLVLNDTRVIPARLFGTDDGERRTEFLLVCRVATLSSQETEVWDCLAKPGRRVKPGRVFDMGHGVSAEVLSKVHESQYRVRFRGDLISTRLLDLGTPPLPPYIHRPGGMADEKDRVDYQTVFAREPGAIAAPTAGLHLTAELLETIREKGIQIAPVTLHVGIGTFRPVKADRVEDHRMDVEMGEIPEATASALSQAKRDGRRVVAVGTTTVRTLEGVALANAGSVVPGPFETNVFITPGFSFAVVDALLTNFHLPRSTLLMLVSAFAGREKVLTAYQEAVGLGYRFFSYGDAMFLP